MKKKSFQGTGTAMVTPFTSDGAIDEPALRRFVDFQIGEGIDMLLPCGTTGEGATCNTCFFPGVFGCLRRFIGHIFYHIF